jgi:putative lipoic acid-binding regulatory protein
MELQLDETGSAFPCDFPVKVMGPKKSGFAKAVVEVFRAHFADLDESTLELRESREGTWLSLTLIVRAVSREQLDDLYRELCDHPMVALVV